MTPWVTRLLIANVAVYVLQMLRPALVQELAYIPALTLERPWTLLTYMFLHGGVGHLFFNMLGLFFFGPRLEYVLGGRKFLLLYGISGLAGAVLSLFTSSAAIIGASGAVYGVMMAFATLWPHEPIYVWGVFPVSARIMVIILTALSLFGGFGGGDGIAHFAHLGGFLGGWAAVRWLTRAERTGTESPQAAMPAPSASDVRRWKSIDPAALHEVNRGELLRVLEKLDKAGPAGLTPAERAFLDRFSTSA
jgi:membrane associated rhomboid family serine protease